MLGSNWADQCRQDFRYSIRTLFKDRRYALLAIVALALGIGASTVVFSVIYDGLLNPFPYKDARGISIFQIHDVARRGNGGRGIFSFNEFLDYREQNHVFSDMVGTAGLNVLYESAGGAQEFPGAFVTTNTFPFLGVKPLLGRWLSDEDGKPGAAPVFVMSYRCWKEQFGGEPKLLGRVFTLNGVSRTLVGIMPTRFRYFGVSVYFPLGLYRGAADSVNEYGRPRYLVAEERRKAGVTLQEVAADVEVIAMRLAAVYPNDYATRLLASQLWGVSANDPVTFALVVFVVVMVGTAASFMPARRATRVAPLVALREE